MPIFIFDLPHVEDEDLPYLHLLTTLLPEIGSGSRNYTQNLEFPRRTRVGSALRARYISRPTIPKWRGLRSTFGAKRSTAKWRAVHTHERDADKAAPR